MKTIIERLYDGELDPGAEIIPQDEDYFPGLAKIADEQEYFKRQLSEEDAGRYEKLEELQSKVSCMTSYANFNYGFRLGVSLMTGIVKENDGLTLPQ